MEFCKAQQALDFATKGLAAVTTELRVELKEVPKEASKRILLNLCMTADNTNCDEVTLTQQVFETIKMRDRLVADVMAQNVLPKDAYWTPKDASEFEPKLAELDALEAENEDAKALRELLLKGVKGIALLCFEAHKFGYEDEGISPFVERILLRTLKFNLSVGLLFNMVLETGGYVYRAMNLVDTAGKKACGETKLTNVELTTRANPGILVCGSDVSVVKELLNLTKNQGVDVYTHDNLMNAHAFEGLQQADNFAGNYGGSMLNQVEDFTSFHGPIVVTASGLMEPDIAYKDRLYTTLPCFYPTIPDVSNFETVIEQAKTCEPPEQLRLGEYVTGFTAATLEKMEETITAAMKDETLKKLVVAVGDDTETAQYYTALAMALPKTSILMTAGSVKYRTMNLQMGTLRGMPRNMDAGAISDLYAPLSVSMKYQTILDKYDINGVPMTYHVSLGSELTYAAMLSIIYAGVKGFYVSEKPAFMTEATWGIFQKNFGIKVATTAEADVEAMFTVKENVAGTISTDMLIIDIIETYPESAEILMSCGMSCVTCGSALYESLAEACMVHGLDPEDVKEVLDHELGLVEDDED